jgi:hypothetical protein
MAQQPPVPPPPPPGTPYAGPPAGARPGSVTGAAVMLIILGVLYALIGVLFVVGGGAASDLLGGGVAGAAIAIGVVVIAYGALDIISGVKVLGLSPGWRIGGIVLTAIGALLALLGTIGAFSGAEELEIDPNTLELTTVSTGPNAGGIIFGLLFLAANVTAMILLIRSGRAFVR